MTSDELVTSDGCPVDVYAELPTFGEPEWIHAVGCAGGSILDLGAGVGRLADPLVDLGHHVVAVDDSADMLARVKRAETVVSRIETLDLAQRFDCVLLASHLINTPDTQLRGQLLRTVRRHLKPDGRALIEWHEPEWFDQLSTGKRPAGQLGVVTTELTVSDFDGRVLHASIEYVIRGARWTQAFTAERLSAQDLANALTRAGLQTTAREAVRRDWVIAKAMPE